LDKQLLDLKYSGIKEVYLLVGYLHEKIEARYGNSFRNMKLHYLVEEEPMGTLWALNNAMQQIDCDIVVRNGDIVCDFNIKNLIYEARRNEDLLTIAITRMRSPYGIVEFSDKKITTFREKPMLNQYINAGIYYIKREAFPYFSREYDKKDIEKTAFIALVEDRKASVYLEDNAYWRSIDSPKDLEEVQREYANRNDKPWGYEKIVVNNEKYLVKELYIKRGFQTSLHYHPNKDESMHILEGEGYILLDSVKKAAYPGSVVRIEPNVVHTIVATENLKIFEYSTPHPEDTIEFKIIMRGIEKWIY
jgi:NDP-sugar pyrophosphorylase family protein